MVPFYCTDKANDVFYVSMKDIESLLQLICVISVKLPTLKYSTLKVVYLYFY